MILSPIPINEQGRLAALRSFEILDSEPEKSFDDITFLASVICKTPISLVSLVDEHRQWFKSKVGLTVAETPRDVSFCGHAICDNRIFIVNDALEDPRFADNPLVQFDPGVRFYAGAPIMTTENLALGTVCVIDREPRTLSSEQASALEALSRQLGLLLESRLKQIELRKALDKVSLLIDSSLDMIIAIDDKQRIIEFNKAAQLTFGYSAQAILGKNVAHLFANPDDGLRARRTIQEEGKFVREVLAKKSSGDVFPCLLSASSLVDRKAKRLGAMGILRDLTEAKKIEKEKNNFISTVNHELRTPLTSITASLGLISEGIVGDVSDDARELVDMAYASCDRLVRLVNDMLDIERIESGSMRFVIEPIEPEPIIRQAIATLHGFAVTFSVEFDVRNECNGLYILADTDRLVQVFVNLLSNAVKYSPPDCAVEIRVSRHHNMIRFAVTDQGPGIPEEHHARLFQKFAQVESVETRKKGGSGLGLSICKAIIESMNGRIWFESAINQGTTFSFELPMSTIHELAPV